MGEMLPTVFHFEEGRPGFEDLGRPNGITHWDEGVLMQALGYESAQAFANALMKAKTACLTLGIECEDHFVRQANGKYLITRFGCYLVAMNGDPRKPEVAAAQVYFAAIAETFKTHLEHAEGIDRVLIREDMKDREKSLAGTAKRHGVENYPFFQSKGYLGMYNMSLQRLKEYKGVSKDATLLDHMGKTELAANLFRITQTEEKITKEKIRGQASLEKTAQDVGREVRNTMQRISGTVPEELPVAEDLKQVRKKLKGTRKQLEDRDRYSLAKTPSTPPPSRHPTPTPPTTDPGRR